MKITQDIFYIGVYDKDLDLFEGQYPLKNGVTYNSYAILDEKIVILDTVDKRAQKQWLANLQKVLGTRKPDYLVISHLEPDHGACIQALCEVYPDIVLVGNAKTFQMLPQFFDFEFKQRIVKDGERLVLGKHTLKFVMAPMVHWPEVMMTYECSQKILFSADAFGTFESSEEAWVEEARRYYFNIVGKYGKQVQNVLKKITSYDIKMICPLHGPILKEDLKQYLLYYNLWSSYLPEESAVLVVCASIHGHTLQAAKYLQEQIQLNHDEAVVYDLCRHDLSEVVSEAFKYDRMVLLASSYDGGVFSPMEDFLHRLKSKNYQNRVVGLVENSSWAPSAIKTMKNTLDTFKDIRYIEPLITIKGKMTETNQIQFQKLVQTLLECDCEGEDCFS